MFRITTKICFTIATLLLLMLATFSQEQTLEPINGGIGISKKPLNCEMTFQLMEDVRNMIQAEPDNGVLILIARLGNGEKSLTLNRRRLYNVREGFQVTLGIRNPIVVAEGERINGFGRVEVYLGGKFVGALVARRNSHVIKCEF
ncbi:MAG: hypothetical protein M3362_20270 [Acidobacteriota bacterium]|nr:hypothetical protein [Acidobacteriota bacterium]